MTRGGGMKVRGRECRGAGGRRRLVGLAVAVVAMCLGATAAVAAVASRLPATHPSALSPADIARLSSNATDRVIVLLHNQHPEAPGQPSAGGIQPAALAQRVSALHGDQQPILSELSTVSAPRVHSYSFVNAISATVSPAEAQRLAANPAVAAVVPDAVRRRPHPVAVGLRP